MADKRTRLIIEATPKGFATTQAAQQQLNNSAVQGAKAQKKAFDDLIKSGQASTTIWQKFRTAAGFPKLSKDAAAYAGVMVDLRRKLAEVQKQQFDLMHAQSGMDKASGGYKKMEESLKKLGDQAQKTKQEIMSMAGAFQRESREVEQYQEAVRLSKGAFLQGLSQGALGGVKIDRAPGALQQAAGVYIGQRGRQMAGGMMQMPFQGMAGLAQVMSAIPGVGPAAAGLMQNAAGFAGMELQRQSVLKELLPMLGPGFKGSYATKGQIAAAVEAERSRPVHVGGKTWDQRVWDLGGPGILPTPETEQTTTHLPADLKGQSSVGGLPPIIAEQQVLADVIKEAGLEQQSRLQTAADKERQRLYRPGLQERIGAAGWKYGAMNQIDALRAAGGVVQVGGGSLQGFDQAGMTNVSFAAQTRYGIGPETQGAYLRGARIGGLGGPAGGNAGERMVQAMSKAVEMGMQGSSAVDFLQEIAQGINQFERTGMPLDDRTVLGIAKSMSVSGLGPARGAQIGLGMTSGAQRIAAGGVNNPIDVLMMQTMGGFNGGGLKGYVEAMEQMETGGSVEGRAKLFDRLFKSAGGGYGGRIVAHNALRQMGVNIGWGETGILQRQREGTATADDLAKLEKIRSGELPGFNTNSLLNDTDQELGKNAWGQRRQAAIQNRQLAAGAGMLEAVQSFDSATTKMTESFTKNVGPTVTTLANSVDALVTKLDSLVTDIRSWFANKSPERDY